MSERIASTESEISVPTAAPLQNTARSESNCFDANEIVRTGYLTPAPDAGKAAAFGRGAFGTAKRSARSGSLSTTLSKVTVVTTSFPEAFFVVLTIVFANRI